MMNYVWLAMVVISFAGAFFTGNISAVSQAVLGGASSAVELIIKLLGAICLWSGLMEIAQRSMLTKYLSAALSPIIKLLFPKYGRGETKNAISLNITANLLGLGNAATPFGIEAMRRMKQESKSDSADNEMIRFVILNSAALTLIPTNIAVIRTAAGSKEPMSILLAVWVSGTLALTSGLILQKIITHSKK